MTGLPSPSRSRVVIIGFSRFHHLVDLPAVSNNVADLAATISDPELCGIPVANCSIVSDDPHGGVTSVHDVIEAVRRASNEVGPDGLLLVYYAGHGLLDSDHGRLHLAVTGSELGEEDAGAVAYESVRRRVWQSKAAHKLVILDCCYAGRALLGEMSGTGLGEDVDIDQSVIIAATSRNLVALAPPGARHTAFTGELLAVLNNGVAHGPQILDAHTIWREVRRAQIAKGLPRPEFRSRNAAGDIPLVRNAWSSRPYRGSAAVLRDASQPAPTKRRHAIAGAFAGLSAIAVISVVLAHWGAPEQPDDFAASAPPAATWPTSVGPATTGSAATGPATTGPATAGATTTRPAKNRPTSTGPAKAGPADTGPANSNVTEPTGGACSDSEISVAAIPATTQVKRGMPLDIRLTIKNIGTRACSREVGADPMEVYLASGPDLLWSSDTCSTAKGSDDRDFLPGEEVEYGINWNGRESTSCAGGVASGTAPPPGRADLRGRLAALVGNPVTVTIVS
jgi:hypothetical protein